MSQPITSVAISMLVADPDVWPRRSWDEERVAMFADLYAADGPNALPPIVVVPRAGKYLIADGWTRAKAATVLKFKELPTRIVEPRAGVSPTDFAYQLALETAAVSARPLTRAERHTAVVKLLAAAPRSDREIAKLVGVAHTTVSRIRTREKTSTTGAPGEQYYASVTAQELATRLFRGMERIWEARGLGLVDAFIGDRTSARLADVLRDSFGDDALDRAVRYRTWINGTIGILRKGSGS